MHPLEQGPGYVHPVPATVAGRVIGPGGTQIREIRDKTGARVRVGNDKIPGTNERPVTIWGTQELIDQVTNPNPDPNPYPNQVSSSSGWPPAGSRSS